MRAPLALLVVLLLAGCAAPATPPDANGPADLAGKRGLLALDTTTGEVSTLATGTLGAWMSPNATYLVWNTDQYGVLFHGASNDRTLIASGVWARLYDNATALELRPGEAAWRSLREPGNASTAPLPDAPRAGGRWTGASADLAVLAAEYAAPGQACAGEIIARGATEVRAQGCHLRVADDGRVGWTEGAKVRLLARDGAASELAANGTSTLENPVFTREGVLHLRLVGGVAGLAQTEVVGAQGETLATMPGPRRLALHDASEDGRFVLLSAFDVPAS